MKIDTDPSLQIKAVQLYNYITKNLHNETSSEIQETLEILLKSIYIEGFSSGIGLGHSVSKKEITNV